jgi:nucleotide-binding universal stress UspA family protein
MEDKLVTLATLTYNKALILKNFLAKAGIEASISSIHPDSSIASSGVYVRIKESDLPQALKVIESPDWLAEGVVGEKMPNVEIKGQSEILVPVDFSEYSMRVCEIAFHIAAQMNYQITLIHVYLASIFPSPLTYGDSHFPISPEKESKKEEKNAQTELKALSEEVNKKIASGEFPAIPYNCVLKAGIPEDEIVKYAKEKSPVLIVMGTRGRHRKDVDLMGSVTAEVIERAGCNILAIPENTPIKDFTTVEHIAFLTNFEQYDLIAFDTFIKSWKPYHFAISLLHLAGTPDTWSEIKLAGIKEYFHHQYPTLDVRYDVVLDDDFLKSLDTYIKEKHIDIIALTSRKRNIFSRLFNPSIAQRMIFHSDTPLMVLNIR